VIGVVMVFGGGGDDFVSDGEEEKGWWKKRGWRRRRKMGLCRCRGSTFWQCRLVRLSLLVWTTAPIFYNTNCLMIDQATMNGSTAYDFSAGHLNLALANGPYDWGCCGFRGGDEEEEGGGRKGDGGIKQPRFLFF